MLSNDAGFRGSSFVTDEIRIMHCIVDWWKDDGHGGLVSGDRRVIGLIKRGVLRGRMLWGSGMVSQISTASLSEDFSISFKFSNYISYIEKIVHMVR